MISVRRFWSLAAFSFLASFVPLKSSNGQENNTGLLLPAGATLRLGSNYLAPGSPICGLVALPDGKHVVAADKTRISVWDLKTGNPVAFAEHPKRTNSICYVVNNHGFLSVDAIAKNLLFHTEHGAWLYSLPFAGQIQNKLSYKPTFSRLGSVVFASPSKSAFALNDFGKLFQSDVQAGENPSIFAPVETTAPKVDFTGAKGPGRTPRQFALTSGGGIVAFSGQQDAKVNLWDAGKNRSIGPLTLDRKPAAIAMSGDGKLLAVSMKSEFRTPPSVQLFSLSDLKQVASWEKAGSLLAISHDGSLIAAVEQSTFKIEVFQSSDGKLLNTLEVVNDWIDCIDFLPDASGLVAGGSSGVIHYWVTKTGQSRHPDTGHSSPIASIQFLPQGEYLTAARDGTLRDWNDRGTTKKTATAIPSGLAEMILSLDGKTAFLGGFRSSGLSGSLGVLRSWDVESLALKNRHSFSGPSTFSGVPLDPYALALSPDGKKLALGEQRKGIQFLSASTLEETGRIKIAPPDQKLQWVWADGSPTALAFAGNDRLISLDRSGTYLRIWDLTRNVELRQFKTLLGLGPALAVSPDEKHFAVQDRNYVLIWDVEMREQVAEFGLPRIEGRGITCLKYLSKSLLAVGDDRGRIWLVDLTKKREPQLLEGHQGAITCLSVSPDGKHFASGSTDTTAIIWKVPLDKQ